MNISSLFVEAGDESEIDLSLGPSNLLSSVEFKLIHEDLMLVQHGMEEVSYRPSSQFYFFFILTLRTLNQVAFD